jgi:hypothetical protein
MSADKKQVKQDKRAAALRENLRRRKQKAKAVNVKTEKKD